MTKEDLARVLNEWMRRYIENPEEYSREFEEVLRYLTDVDANVTPSYGEIGAEYCFELLGEIS